MQGVVATISLLSAGLIGGAVFWIIATAALIYVIKQAQQRAAGQPGTILFAHKPMRMLGASIGVALALVWLAVSADDAWLIRIALITLFFALAIYIAFAVSSLPFWTADNTSLTRHLLMAQKTLRWDEIDWVYGVQNTATRRGGRGVTEQKLIVEAGPRRRIVITMNALGTSPGASLKIQSFIQDHAKQAVLGFGRIHEVERRRAAARNRA